MSQRPRSLAYFTNEYPSVSHSFVRREIEALEQRGWTVHRFSLRAGRGIVDAQDRAELERTVRLAPLRLPGLLQSLAVLLSRPLRGLSAIACAVRMGRRRPRFLRSLFSLCWAALMLRHCRRLGIAHAHAHFGTNSASVLLLLRKLGGPSFSFTNHAPFEIEHPWVWSLPEKVAQARFAVAISKLGRAQLMRVTPQEHWQRVAVVRCGVDPQRVQPTPVPDTPQLLCVARLSEEKGHRVLLGALAQLRRDGVACRLVLAGDGPMRGELERESARLELTEVVHFAGSVDEQRVNQLLAESRALVLASFAEGLPVVLMEAFRAGRPVVTSNVGAIDELVDAHCGWLVPAGDQHGFAAALRAVLTTPVEELNRMGGVGRSRLEAQHDSASEAAVLCDLFERHVARD